MSFDSSEIAFTIAVATVIALVYLFYNVFFKKSVSTVDSSVESSDVQKQESGQIKTLKISLNKTIKFLSVILNSLANSNNNDFKQSKSKDKKQNQKPVKTKETVLKHSWLSATLKGEFFLLNVYLKLLYSYFFLF